MTNLYTFSEPTIILGSGQFKVKVIETPLNNIKPETILKPISQTSYYGINGGFYIGDYKSPPERSDSISWSYNDMGNGKNYNYNGSQTNQVSRKTLVVYQYNNFYFGATMYAKNITEVRNKYPEAREVIGGFGLEESDWGSPLAYYGPTSRTFMAFDGNVSKRIGYLIISPARINVLGIKNTLTQLGLRHQDAIVLDGSGSTSMKIPTYHYKGEDRYIYNMIRLRSLKR